MGTTCALLIIGREYKLSAIVDIEDYQTLRLWDYRWHRIIGQTTTYIATTDNKNRKTIYLHRLIMGLIKAPRSIYVDHIDGNGLNNSRTNLRVTDNRGNQRNQRKELSAKTSSPYKGVCKIKSHKISNPWAANITLPEPGNLCSDNKRRGKKKHLGHYRTEIEAARAYNEAAIELFGLMAQLNELSD